MVTGSIDLERREVSRPEAAAGGPQGGRGEVVLVVSTDVGRVGDLREGVGDRHVVVRTDGAEEALTALDTGLSPAVVICDPREGAESAARVLDATRGLAPDATRVVNDYAGADDLLEAVNAGRARHVIPNGQDVAGVVAIIDRGVAEHLRRARDRRDAAEASAAAIHALLDLTRFARPEAAARGGRSGTGPPPSRRGSAGRAAPGQGGQALADRGGHPPRGRRGPRRTG